MLDRICSDGSNAALAINIAADARKSLRVAGIVEASVEMDPALAGGSRFGRLCTNIAVAEPIEFVDYLAR